MFSKNLLLLLTPLFIFPVAALANTSDPTVQSLLGGLMNFLFSSFLPFLLALAFLFFAINVVRYFIVETDDVSKRANAKNLALYGVLAFVFILIFWGLVNLLVAFFNLGGRDSLTSDYVIMTTPGLDPPPDADSQGGFMPPWLADQEPSPDVTQPADINEQEPGFTDPLPDQEEVPGSFIPGDNEAQNPGLTPGGGTEDDQIDPGAIAQAESDRDNMADGLQFVAEGFFTDGDTTQAEILFGDLAPVVENSGLFDLTGASNDAERLAIAYRMLQLEAIDQSQYDSYLNAINAVRNNNPGLNPIASDFVPNIAVTDVPENIQSAMTATENNVRTLLEQQQSATGFPTSVANEMSILFDTDTTLSRAERLDHATNQLGNIFQDDEVYDSFMDYLQVEQFLSGENIGQQI